MIFLRRALINENIIFAVYIKLNKTLSNKNKKDYETNKEITQN